MLRHTFKFFCSTSLSNATAASAACCVPIFASGYKMPQPVADKLKQTPEAQRFTSQVWFTENQFRSLRDVRPNPGEKPLVLVCPPGTMRVQTLTLYNSEQTSRPDFFPAQIRSPFNHEQVANAINYKLRRDADTTVGNNSNSTNGFVASPLTDNASSPPRPLGSGINDGGAQQPHFWGGMTSTATTTTKTANDDQPLQQKDHRPIPRHLWATLTSVAQQHGWGKPGVANFWYTRAGMRAAGVAPRKVKGSSSSSSSSNNAITSTTTTTALPLVVRIHGKGGESGQPQYVCLWNAAQVEATTTLSDGDMVANPDLEKIVSNHHHDESSGNDAGDGDNDNFDDDDCMLESNNNYSSKKAQEPTAAVVEGEESEQALSASDLAAKQQELEEMKEQAQQELAELVDDDGCLVPPPGTRAAKVEEEEPAELFA